MQDTRLEERLRRLESDLLAKPPRISAYSELPCALFRYDPAAEWEFRREVRKLATRLENEGRTVHMVSAGEFVWTAIDEAEGLDRVVELEEMEGWEATQRQISVYLADPDFLCLPKALSERLSKLRPSTDIAFLWRAAAFSPGIYLCSKLLDELKGLLEVPTVLFYPGMMDEHGLRFMGLADRESTSSYRVKIYQ